ncbi:MAG: Fur family transcriptional regulator [Ktedonobacterales bacterium]
MKQEQHRAVRPAIDNVERSEHVAQRVRRHDDAVLQALRAARTHPTAAALYDEVRRAHPRIGRATVYRALQRLEAAGLAVEVGRDSFGRHYDARVERHDHAVCSTCGKVIDLLDVRSLPDETLAPLMKIARQAGFAAGTYEIRLYGRCATCQGLVSDDEQRHD